MDASSLLLVALSSRDVSDDVPPLTAGDLGVSSHPLDRTMREATAGRGPR